MRLAEFTKRLIRRLSSETGILERRYDLDRGTTEAFAAHGFAGEIGEHSSTNIELSRLSDILQDQEAAVTLVVDCVANNRQLTRGVLHELHAILVRGQDTTTTVDRFGNGFVIPLKGKVQNRMQ